MITNQTLVNIDDSSHKMVTLFRILIPTESRKPFCGTVEVRGLEPLTF